MMPLLPGDQVSIILVKEVFFCVDEPKRDPLGSLSESSLLSSVIGAGAGSWLEVFESQLLGLAFVTSTCLIDPSRFSDLI